MTAPARLLAGMSAAALLTAACGRPPEAAPLPDSTLVVVFTDLHLAGARLRLEPGVPDGQRDSVLQRHGVDPADFEASVAWLRDHPDAFVGIYGSVLDRLNALPADSSAAR